MHIELNEQERLRAQQGQPLDVIDPQTNEAYVLIAREHFHQEKATLPPESEAWKDEIPEGIRISQEAYRRELPEFLKQKKLLFQWVAYHRNERLAITNTGQEALRECLKRGLAGDEFFVGWIAPCGLVEEEEIEPRLDHYVEDDDENS